MVPCKRPERKALNLMATKPLTTALKLPGNNALICLVVIASPADADVAIGAVNMKTARTSMIILFAVRNILFLSISRIANSIFEQTNNILFVVETI